LNWTPQLLQYKQRCTDLESKLGHPMSFSRYEDLQFGSPLKESLPDYPGSSGGGLQASSGGASGVPHMGMHSGRVGFAPSGGGGGLATTPTVVDLDDAMWKLEQERIRNENLMQLNRDLRNELDETRKLNNALSTDLGKLSDDWEKLTRQMGERENLWKAEEQAYSDYYASEHAKLLALWKKVAGMKRDFAEVKSATGRDLAQLKNNLGRIANQVATGVITATVASPSPQQVYFVNLHFNQLFLLPQNAYVLSDIVLVIQEAEQAAFIAQLTHEITMAQNSQENLRKQMKDRDDRILALESTLTDLDAKATSLEQELTRVTTQELGLLQNSLREIGKLLISDFEQHGTEGEGHDLHLSSTPAIYIYDDTGENPTVFAESIVSAVQAALNKRQLQIHALQVCTSVTRHSDAISD